MPLKVSICIATYKRPEGLKNLLEGLNGLTFSKVQQPNIEVIIIDNDAAGSAQTICDEVESRFRWSLVYAVEPRQGVTYARNHSVEKASTETDFMTFIDDDEVPEPSWLDELLFIQQTHSADVVTGPVHPRFENPEIPAWIHKGGFFDPTDQVTGTEIDIAYTNNVLVNADCLRNLGTVFDEGLAFKGSEDVHLFMRLSKSGAKIVWANEAIVYESIPQERTQLNWLLKRNYYGWSCHSRLEKDIYPSLKLQITRMIKGFILLAMGLAMAVPSLLFGRHSFVKSLIYIYRGTGTISGLAGYQGAWGGANR